MIRLFKRYYPVRNMFFVLGEGMLILMTLSLTGTLMNPEKVVWALSAENLLMTLICQVCLYYGGLYDLAVMDSARELVGRLIQALGGTAIILSAIHLWVGREMVSNRSFMLSLSVIVALAVSWRFLYTLALNCRMFDKTVLVLGESPLIRSILHEAGRRKDSGYHLIHAVSSQNAHRQSFHYTAPLSTSDENHHGLLDLARTLNARLIVSDKIAEGCTERYEEALLECRVNGIKVLEAHTFFEMITGKLHVSQVSSCWLIFSEGFHRPFYHDIMKTTVDKLAAFMLLVLLSPLIVLTALLIKLDSRGPVFYAQERLGKGREPYYMYKFRSMVFNAESKTGPQWAMPDDMRITRVGALLRNYRIDEIPQLWNVLKGEMSLVGPRPERDYFVKRLETIIPYYGIRFTVKPGITGWAQVNYGYGASDDDAMEKLNYDLYYIKNSSVFMDVFILFKTTRTVILGVECNMCHQAETTV